MSRILRHRGIQLILAYSWARPAVLAEGKGRGECFYFFCFLTFIHFSFSPLLSLLSLFSLSLVDDTRDDVSLKPNSISQTFFVGTSIKWGQSVL